jgi:hypothetical protein
MGAFFGGVFLPGVVSGLPSFVFVLFVRSFAIPHPLSYLYLLPATLTSSRGTPATKRPAASPQSEDSVSAPKRHRTHPAAICTNRTGNAVEEDRTRRVYHPSSSKELQAGATLSARVEDESEEQAGNRRRSGYTFIALPSLSSPKHSLGSYMLGLPWLQLTSTFRAYFKIEGCSVVDHATRSISHRFALN